MPKVGVEWSQSALDDLDNIRKYIAEENPYEAIHVLDEIESTSSVLVKFPFSGKMGRVKGTRELVIKKVHYTIIYETSGHDAMVLRVVRQCQQWPPSE